jgi:hypothetical protein
LTAKSDRVYIIEVAASYTIKISEVIEMTNTQKYLNVFFEEKALDERTYEIENDGMTHFVESEFVIEVIKNSTSAAEQEQIANIIRKIDFMNGDVHHFLQHLATGYVKNNY